MPPESQPERAALWIPPRLHPPRIDRRRFLAGTVAGSAGVAAADLCADQKGSQFHISCCMGDDPVGCIRRKRFHTLVAFVEAQLWALWRCPPDEDPVAVANDVLRYLAFLEKEFQQGICGALVYIDIYSLKETHRAFNLLTPRERTELLNQGEYPLKGRWPLILWDCEYVLHTAVSSLAMICRMITNSRRPARILIGMTWSQPCRDPKALVSVPRRPYPDLSQPFDVCVIGTGAGGSVAAARAAEAGRSVVMVDWGKWISPDALVERELNARGEVEIFPARCDRVLSELYRGGGVNLAGDMSEMIDNRMDLILPWRRRKVEPQQTINVLQAKVVGGGPYVNNAIHLEIREDAWDRWGDRQPLGVSYADLWGRMLEVKLDLGVNREVTRHAAGARSWKFVNGCILAGEDPQPTPVAILEGCHGCGADNSMDPFGWHTGGLHPYAKGGPNSYLMRALHAPLPVQVAYETAAVRFQWAPSPAGGVFAESLVVEDGRDLGPHCCGRRVVINARQFVLAAGCVASTNILRQSLGCAGLCAPELGERLTANIGTPVYAVFDKPIIPCEQGDLPEPGVAQCFVVDRRVEIINGQPVVTEPDLENWFHFPGTVAIALSGWFQEYARIMRKYNHISISGLFVATKVRPTNRIKHDGTVLLELDWEEFELLLAGIERIGRIYLAAATPENGVTLYLPTKAVLLDDCCRPLAIRTYGQLLWAVNEIRKRGPEFVNLLTSHPQGGNPLGGAVDRATFRVQLSDGRLIDNLHVADASIFPAGCEMNPQLTVHALAHFAADRLLAAA